jgi:hypothetical protein
MAHMKDQIEKDYVWVIAGFAAAKHIKESEGTQVRIIESKPRGEDKVVLFVGVSSPDAEEFVKNCKMMGCEVSNINPDKIKAKKPVAPKPKPEPEPEKYSDGGDDHEDQHHYDDKANQPCDGGEGCTCGFDPMMTLLNNAFHFISHTMKSAVTGGCHCPGCTATKTLLDFVAPFVRFMEGAAPNIPLTGKHDVDQALMKNHIVNQAIVERGCCPNAKCSCERLIPIEKVHEVVSPNHVGLLVCKHCGFAVNRAIYGKQG